MTTVAGRSSRTRPHDAVTLILATYGCVKIYWLLSARAGRWMDYVAFEGALKLALWVTLPALVLWALYRPQRWSFWSGLGLDRGMLPGLVFGLLATLPMVVAAAFLPRKPLDLDLATGSSLLGPIAEEPLFRGFLFAYLIRRAGWSTLAALIVSSILFGLAHYRNVDDLFMSVMRGVDWRNIEWVGVNGAVINARSGTDVWLSYVDRLPFMLEFVLPYAAAGALFAWVTDRWNSLWPAIALHCLMNFCWDLAAGEHGRLEFRIDPMSAAQAMSVGLAILLTYWYRSIQNPWRGRIRPS